MNDYNTLVLCKSKYNSEYEFWDVVKQAIKLLLDEEYIITVRYDANEKNLGVICIDYNPADQSFGCHYPRWLTPEQYENVIWKAVE